MHHQRAVGIAALALGLAAASAASLRGPAAAGSQSAAPDFLQPGRCYRLAFAVEGAPAYKVLERLDGGWLRGEVDAGPSSAQRRSIWINAAQIITAAETRCAD